VGFRLNRAGVERDMDNHAVHHYLVVIGKIRRSSKRPREQAATLRTEIVARTIRADEIRVAPNIDNEGAPPETSRSYRSRDEME
jgi:hypothetical protein